MSSSVSIPVYLCYINYSHSYPINNITTVFTVVPVYKFEVVTTKHEQSQYSTLLMWDSNCVLLRSVKLKDSDLTYDTS